MNRRKFLSLIPAGMIAAPVVTRTALRNSSKIDPAMAVFGRRTNAVVYAPTVGEALVFAGTKPELMNRVIALAIGTPTRLEWESESEFRNSHPLPISKRTF